MGQTLSAHQDKDEKLNVRIPRAVKKRLREKAEAQGYGNKLSPYVRDELIKLARK